MLKTTTTIRYKLGSCDGDLDYYASLHRLAKNVAATDWLLRSNGMPESERQSTRKIKRKDSEDKPKCESTKLYDCIVEKVPTLGTYSAPMIAAQVAKYLNGKVDWRRGFTEEGRRRKRKDAILDYEDRPPYFTADEILIHNQQVTLELGDTYKVILKRMTRGEGEPCQITFEISLKGLPARFKQVLVRAKSGKKKLKDSKLIKKNGQWYWHLPVDFERPELDSSVEVVFEPVIPSLDGDPERPFKFIQETEKLDWFIGDGRYLQAQTVRIESLIKQIGWRYKQRRGTGHGRKKINRAISRRRTILRNIVADVRRKAIQDVVRYVNKHQAGVVVYREPTGPVKEKCWFHRSGLTWDWTDFAKDLRCALMRAGVELKTKKLSLGEVIKREKKIAK